MTFLDVLEVLEAAARTVDASPSNTTYYRGRIQDISMASVTAKLNLIYVEDTIRVVPESTLVTDQWTIRLGFFRQDSTSSESMEANQIQPNEESREIIFSETHKLARRYLDALYNEDTIQIVNVPTLTQVNFTRALQGTFTGWGCDIVVQIAVGCDYNTEIQDAVYQNDASPTFQQSIKRGEVYTAPKITVTDSDGSTYEQNANEDVTCTFVPGGSCEYEIIVNGESQGTVTLANCEDLTITVP